MIVIGYQGIGKSTLANKDLHFIDLESSNFFVNGERASNWHIPYCNIAEHLSQQGYIVFTSSHEVVRDRLKYSGSTEKIICCVPALELKDKWIERLQKRYDTSGLEKDYKALMNAMNCYEQNISEIAASGFDVVWLKSMDYDLRLKIYMIS